MVAEHYLLSAKNLAKRNKVQLDSSRSSIDQETDNLFYWLMRRLENSVDRCQPAKKSHNITVNAYSFDKYFHVRLKDNMLSEYCSKFVTGDDCYTAMKNVVEIFNEIGLSQSDGYYYRADFTRFCPSSGGAQINVIMSIK